MKKLALSVVVLAGLALLASCKKDNTTTEGTFKASIEQQNQNGKTAIDTTGTQGVITWSENDQILISNGTEAKTFTLQTGAGSDDGTFSTNGEFDMTGNYTAAYPATANINGTTVTFSLPATQTMADGESGTFANGANPMVAVASGETNLAFKNPCGGLGIRLKGATEGVTVTNIRIIGSDTDVLWGDLTVTMNGNGTVASTSIANTATDKNKIDLTCNVTLSTTEAKRFFIVLPEGALQHGFTLEVSYGAADPYSKSTGDTNIAQVERNMMKSLNAITIGAAAPGWDGNLATLTGSEPEGYVTATDGMTIYGTLAANVKVSIADGATVTLSNATITYSSNSSSNNYAGITCPGDATLVLAGTNTVQPAYNNWPAIHVATSHTLTIRGGGSLNATNTGDAAAIGAGGPGHACGNIVIESGNITATSINAAAIGGGQSTTGTCGNITISGGTVNATSSQCAGIGGGQGFGSCGNIIISDGNVTATSNYSCAGIGAGMGFASCGTITISGGTVNATSANGTGIGAGLSNSSCGAIYISGGNITARSNGEGAGIGAGLGSNCGAITITDGVESVTAIKGSEGQYCIGKAEGGTSCGTITIGGTEYPTGANPNVDDVTYVYPFQDPELTTGNVTDYQTAGTGHVTLTNAGTGPVTELGLCWGTSSTPTVSNSHAAAAGQTVGTVYDVNINGLTSGTLYYIRGYAKVGSNYYYASNTRTLMLVSSLSDWNSLASVVNNGTAATVQVFQTANISGVTTVVGTESHPFNGTYNGQGYAISNVSIHGSTHVGLFGYVNDASAVIENVVVASGSVSGTGQNVGAIVGTVHKGTVRYCANYAQVSSSLNTSANTRVGGIVGWMRSNGGTDNHVEYCINYGAVHAKYYVGGVVGSHGTGYLTYCQNYGTITGNFNTSAGIAGWSTDYEYVTNNHNGGNIIAGSTSNKVERFVIGNKNGNEGFPSNNTYLSSLTVTSAGTVYTGSSLSSFTWATALTSNPAGITIGGTTYGPTTPAP